MGSSIRAQRPAALITPHLGGNAVTLWLCSQKTSLPFTGCWEALCGDGVSLARWRCFMSSYPLPPMIHGVRAASVSVGSPEDCSFFISDQLWYVLRVADLGKFFVR